MTVGERLKYFREGAKLSQNALAKKAGIPRPLVSQLESGKRQGLTVETAKLLARALGISIDHLVGTWDEPSVDEDAPAPLVGAKRR